MGVGSVTIVQVNNNQGAFTEVERVFLFVGKIGDAAKEGTVIPISAASNLDTLLGSAASELKTQITAARQNARSDNWVCYAIGIDPETDDWKEVVYAALDKPSDLNVEAIVLCSPVVSKAEVEACQVVAVECLARYAKFVCVFAAVGGIEATESWGDYIARIGALVDNVAAPRVSLVPLLHDNDLGVVAGRLCDPAVTVADSPMRVATGALVGLGADPVDKDNAPLNSATVKTLATARFSVAQWYTGYDGMYWADHAMLDAEGGDYQVYENIRVIDYLSRRVRILAIARIADRRLNSTPASIAANATYFMRPLREAARSITIGGIEQPAMIEPPADGDIAFTWTSQTEVAIAITAKPYNCPKKITVYLGLDLSGE